ncbi:homoserine O-acetyltransferase MetX [Kyrpidia spormannii]|nr:homoserine O-acetyltransferase [Kyrpidia spormannii]
MWRVRKGVRAMGHAFGVKGVVKVGPVTLDSGRVLDEVDIAYEAYGDPENARDRTILVCHALTGDAHAGNLDGQPGWWDGLIGPGRVLDTNRFYIVCSNVLGGCAGSTGPASPGPDGRPWGLRFPPITIRDMVEAQRLWLEKLGITHLYAVIGGSMGGMQALEWAVTYPDRVERCIPIATSARLSAMAIAYNDVMRLAIMNDPAWNGGDYYNGEKPAAGLALARMVGMITYRGPQLYNARFGRSVVGREEEDGPVDFEARFQVESYLRYQGEKLVRRFDANSYLYLIKAMDLHDIGRGRGGVAAAYARTEAEFLCIGIDSDMLYPAAEQIEIAEGLAATGKRVEYREIRSVYGHDAFLVEFQQMSAALSEFLNPAARSVYAPEG